MHVSPFESLVMGSEPEFDMREAARLTGASFPRLKGWANRELTVLVNQRPGRTIPRMYSRHNLVIISFALRLLDLQIGTMHAISAAAQIWIDILDFVRTPPEAGDRRFSDIADAIAVIRPSDGSAPLNVLVVYRPQDIPTRNLIDGNATVILSCGRVLTDLATRLDADAHQSSDAARGHS